jgi:nitrogen fixation NifU-like protein
MSVPEPELDELYRELILDHYRNPRNRVPLESPAVVAEGYNPLCGDEVELRLNVVGDVISDVSFTGRGCSISQASGSMLTEVIKGKTVAQARALIALFTRMMTDPDFVPEED